VDNCTFRDGMRPTGQPLLIEEGFSMLPPFG
jgi:hypothetical protein